VCQCSSPRSGVVVDVEAEGRMPPLFQWREGQEDAAPEDVAADGESAGDDSDDVRDEQVALESAIKASIEQGREDDRKRRRLMDEFNGR